MMYKMLAAALCLTAAGAYCNPKCNGALVSILKTSFKVRKLPCHGSMTHSTLSEVLRRQSRMVAHQSLLPAGA